LNGLASAIALRGGRIFTGNRVVSIKGGESVRLETREGYNITAGTAVVRFR